MTIRLPIGFEPGDYALQVLESELRSRATAHTRREIRGFVTRLDAPMDLSSMLHDSYQLAKGRGNRSAPQFKALYRV